MMKTDEYRIDDSRMTRFFFHFFPFTALRTFVLPNGVKASY